MSDEVRTCDLCGEDIIFRWMGGGPVPIHPSGGCRGYSSTASGREKPAEAFTHPTTCPYCEAQIFYHTNGYGDSVFFDDLGKPWDKHPCFDTSSPGWARTSAVAQHVAQQRRPPTIIAAPSRARPLGFEKAVARQELVGLVLSVVEIRVHLQRQQDVVASIQSVFVVVLVTAENELVTVYVAPARRPRIGTVIRVAVVPAQVDDMLVLYATTFTEVPWRT